MTTAQKYIAGIFALALLAFGVGYALFVSQQWALGASINSYEAGVKQFGNGAYFGLNQQAGFDSSGAFTTTATTTQNSLSTQVTSGTCSTASSTVFAIDNPFGATSTLIFGNVYGQFGATSTDFVVGTSTARAWPGLATSSASQALIGLASTSANGQFFSTAGLRSGPGTGYSNPATGPYVTSPGIVVGPNEKILGFSTSTGLHGALDGGNANASQLAVPASCTYKFEWFR